MSARHLHWSAPWRSRVNCSSSNLPPVALNSLAARSSHMQLQALLLTCCFQYRSRCSNGVVYWYLSPNLGPVSAVHLGERQRLDNFGRTICVHCWVRGAIASPQPGSFEIVPLLLPQTFTTWFRLMYITASLSLCSPGVARRQLTMCFATCSPFPWILETICLPEKRQTLNCGGK